jgi:hypothetical protein
MHRIRGLRLEALRAQWLIGLVIVEEIAMFADRSYNLILSSKPIFQATIFNLKPFTLGDEPFQGIPS